MIDHSLQHHNRLYNANKGMDEMLGSGSSILANLKEQRLSLKVGCVLRMFNLKTYWIKLVSLTHQLGLIGCTHY